MVSFWDCVSQGFFSCLFILFVVFILVPLIVCGILGCAIWCMIQDCQNSRIARATAKEVLKRG